jgi:hypothetical protein
MTAVMMVCHDLFDGSGHRPFLSGWDEFAVDQVMESGTWRPPSASRFSG